MTKKRRILKNDSERNDDWMKTLPGYQDEIAIHEELARKQGDSKDAINSKEYILKIIRKKGSSRSGNWGHTGKAGMWGGSNTGGGHSQVSGSKVPGGKGKGKATQKPKVKAKLTPKKKPQKPKAPDFQDVKTYWQLTDEYEKWKAGLSDEEIVAIGDYSIDTYWGISVFLREEEEWGDDIDLEDSIRAMDAALERSTIPRNITVYRGLNVGRFQDVEVGDTITDLSYVSTSISQHTAQGFAVQKEYGAIIQIKLPKGSKGAALGSLSGLSEEEEVLLPRGSVFRVDAINTVRGISDVKLVLTVIDQPTPEKFKEWILKKEAKKKKKKKRNPADKYVWEEGQIIIKKKTPKK